MRLSSRFWITLSIFIALGCGIAGFWFWLYNRQLSEAEIGRVLDRYRSELGAMALAVPAGTSGSRERDVAPPAISASGVQGPSAIRRVQAITLAVREPATLVAEATHITISMAFDPGSGYRREWYSTKWPFATSYHCESSTRKIRWVLPSIKRKYPARLRLPLGFFQTWNTSLDNDVVPDPTLPLPAGAWSCWIERTVILVRTNGTPFRIPLASNRIAITIAEPSDEDRAVLIESGLWDKLMKVDDQGAPWPAIDYNSYSAIIKKHPRSGYYCKFMATEYRKSFSAVIQSRDDKERLYYSVRFASADWCKYDYAHIVDLERSSCASAATDELAAWKVRYQLCMGNMGSAQRISHRALRADPRPEFTGYFRWTLNLSAADLANAQNH